MSQLSLLVVDISSNWEEELKAQERGYFIDWDYFKEEYELANGWKPYHRSLKYPYGSTRAGIDAVVDTARVAHESGIKIYCVDTLDQWSDGDDDVCYSLQQYIPKENRYFKYDHSAFSCKELAERLEQDRSGQLLIIGYDRDCCLLETVKDAISRGMKVATSEHCMLTIDLNKDRDKSLAYYKEHTTYIESLIDVWNFIIRTCK